MPAEKRAKGIDRLKSDKDFELIYGKGIAIISEDKKLKAKYLFLNRIENNRTKFGVSVISKKGNSVWRNRIKRILREALLKERDKLLDIANQKNSTLLIIFSPYTINQKSSKKIFLKDINPAVLNLLNKIKLTSV